MKYLLAIAVFLAGACFPITLGAQSVVLTSGSHAEGSWLRSAPFPDGPSEFRRFGGPRMVVLPRFWGYPSDYPFTAFYPSLWLPLDVQYQEASRIAHGDVKAEVAAQEKSYLSSQIKALTDEVQSLRTQKTKRQYAQMTAGQSASGLPQQPSPQGGALQNFPPTVFIYRDGHEMEVRDYAIMGQTLWVFKSQTSRKYPLADFNLDASRQVNEEHGVEFPLSNPR